MKPAKMVVAVGLALVSMFAVSKDDNVATGKAFPEVTFDKVQEIFGHNLDTDSTMLKTLLLAISMDHTSNNSPHSHQYIGIPYIVDRGPGYWVTRLKSGEKKLDVLVNNALLLLFTKEEIPDAKETGLALLKTASDMGYWPADYYVAENNLVNYLSMDYTSISPTSGVMNGETKSIARDTMKRYNMCAEMGFAPCQYRIGFWLSGSPQTLKDGLNVLRTAIHTTTSDTRYRGVLDGALVMAAKEIVFKGDQVGIDTVVRAEYANLVKRQLAQVSKIATNTN
ncbi:MAG: hypothetical protein MI864_14955 [Pseudomonadales bacterium]|nr:hypothetical protein [Pseudomonadales bacterium]